jgi:hypothetical protein
MWVLVGTLLVVSVLVGIGIGRCSSRRKTEIPPSSPFVRNDDDVDWSTIVLKVSETNAELERRIRDLSEENRALKSKCEELQTIVLNDQITLTYPPLELCPISARPKP